MSGTSNMDGMNCSGEIEKATRHLYPPPPRPMPPVEPTWVGFRDAIYAELAGSLKGADQAELMRCACVTANMMRSIQKLPGGIERVNLNEDGTVDEVVGRGALHMEQMSEGSYYLDLAGVRFLILGRGKVRVIKEG